MKPLGKHSSKYNEIWNKNTSNKRKSLSQNKSGHYAIYRTVLLELKSQTRHIAHIGTFNCLRRLAVIFNI